MKKMEQKISWACPINLYVKEPKNILFLCLGPYLQAQGVSAANKKLTHHKILNMPPYMDRVFQEDWAFKSINKDDITLVFQRPKVATMCVAIQNFYFYSTPRNKG